MRKTYVFIDNIDEVLERLGGNTALLDKLLKKFIEIYQDTGTRLSELVSGAQFEDAHRLVHSIKGVAGNLGLNTLYHSALEVEQLMKDRQFTGIDEETDRFLADLEDVIEKISGRE